MTAYAFWNRWLGYDKYRHRVSLLECGLLACETTVGETVPQDCIGLILVKTANGIKSKILMSMQTIEMAHTYAKYWLVYQETLELLLRLPDHGVNVRLGVRVGRGCFGGVVEQAFLDWLWTQSVQVEREALADCVARLLLEEDDSDNKEILEFGRIVQVLSEKMGLLCLYSKECDVGNAAVAAPRKGNFLRTDHHLPTKACLEHRLFIELPQFLVALQSIGMQMDETRRQDLLPALSGLQHLAANVGRLPDHGHIQAEVSVLLDEIGSALSQWPHGKGDVDFCKGIVGLVVRLQCAIGKV